MLNIIKLNVCLFVRANLRKFELKNYYFCVQQSKKEQSINRKCKTEKSYFWRDFVARCVNG